MIGSYNGATAQDSEVPVFLSKNDLACMVNKREIECIELRRKIENLENKIKLRNESLMDFVSAEYQVGVPHQSELKKCRCRNCIVERAKKLIKEI